MDPVHALNLSPSVQPCQSQMSATLDSLTVQGKCPSPSKGEELIFSLALLASGANERITG
jgi:hypothetical protein